MADEATTTSAETAASTTDEQTAATQEASTSTTTAEAAKTYTQEQVNAMLADHKKRIQGQFSDYDDLKQSVTATKAAEEAAKSQLEEVTKERTTLQGQLAASELDALKLKVVMDKGVPAALVDRLNGTSREELEADADALLEAVKPPSGGFDGGVRTTSAGSIDIATETDPTKVLEWAKSL